MQITPRFVDLLAIYRAELLERVVPFWLEQAVDRDYGGLLTCISDEGQILSRDKYMWSQLRAIWTFSALYNRVEPRPEWLEVARHIYDFAKQHGRDEQGHWVFAVSKEGDVLEGATSIYADGFAIYGLTELARATGDPAVVELALSTYQSVQRRLARPGSYRTAPFEIPDDGKAHAISMIFSLVFNELGHYLEDETIIQASLFHANEVMDVYRRPDRRLLYEFVRQDGSLIDTPQGRSIVPGHAIESMWFMIHIFRRQADEVRLRQAIETIKWHVEVGWDDEYGGIVHALDADEQTPWWRFAEAKLWWPQTEALYALLLAYEISQEAWCLEWFERVHNYAFSRYPVPEFGEWTQKLNRHGQKITDTVALPVKDPFHLPRALIYCSEVLERLAEGPTAV